MILTESCDLRGEKDVIVTKRGFCGISFNSAESWIGSLNRATTGGWNQAACKDRKKWRLVMRIDDSYFVDLDTFFGSFELEPHPHSPSSRLFFHKTYHLVRQKLKKKKKYFFFGSHTLLGTHNNKLFFYFFFCCERDWETVRYQNLHWYARFWSLTESFIPSSSSSSSLLLFWSTLINRPYLCFLLHFLAFSINILLCSTSSSSPGMDTTAMICMQYNPFSKTLIGNGTSKAISGMIEKLLSSIHPMSSPNLQKNHPKLSRYDSFSKKSNCQDLVF